MRAVCMAICVATMLSAANSLAGSNSKPGATPPAANMYHRKCIESERECYVLVDAAHTWLQAWHVCADQLGGNLAWLHTADRVQLVYDWLDSIGELPAPSLGEYVHVGMAQTRPFLEPDGYWHWLNADLSRNGTADFAPWHDGEPNERCDYTAKDCDCGALYLQVNNTGLADSWCSHGLRSLCQLPMQ